MVEQKDQQKNQAKLELENKGNIKEKDLELSLRENTSLTDKQIQEIVPILLEVVKKLQSCEEQASAEATGKNLKELKQTVANGPVTNNTQNNQNVEIDLKNNYGRVFGAVTYNKKTNNYYITINQLESETPKVETPKVEAPKVETPKIEAPKVEAPKVEAPKVETPKIEAPKPVQMVQNKTSIDNNMADIHTLVGFLSMVDKLLLEIEDTKNGISKKGLTKAGKKTMDDAKKKLEQYEKQLKGKKEGLKKQNKSEIYDSDVAHLKSLWEDVNQVRKDIGLGQWGEFSSTAGFLYNSPENAKEGNKRQMSSIEFNQKLKEEVKKGAILNIFNGNVQMATDFYRRIAQGEYTQADYQLFTTNAAILTSSFQSCGIAVPVWPKYIQRNLTAAERTGGLSSGFVDYDNMSLGEAFESGGISGLVGKALSNCNNMTPGQRNTWRNLATVGCYAAGIFGLYKFFTSKKKWRAKAGITGAAILGSQMLTGEGPLTLINKLISGGISMSDLNSKFGNAFGDAVNGIGKSGIESASTIAPAMCSMMVFNPQTTIGDINTMTEQYKRDPNARMVFRGEAINKLRNKYGQQSAEYFSATFSDKFDERKRNSWLASIGIADVSNISRQNVRICELADNAAMNEVIIEKYRTEHGVKETSDKKRKKEYEEYVQNLKNRNQAIDIAVLEQHPEWFELDKKATYTERTVDNQFKETLVNQVNGLGIDEAKKLEIKTAIKNFYDKRNIDVKPLVSDFSLSTEEGLLVLTSHGGQKTKIDVNKNEIVNFGNEIRFSDFSELLDVADLANKILESQKGQIAVGYPPFQYKIERKGICFNSANNIRKDIITRNNSGMDTRVLSTGRGGATGKIDTLYNHPKEFAEYLSKRRMDLNKPVS